MNPLQYHPVQAVQLAAFRLHSFLHQDEPWIAPAVVKMLDETLSRDMDGFEWGSGSSTAWFAKRLRSLHSVESDEGWFEIVKKRTAGAMNIQLDFIALDHPKNEPCRPFYEQTPRYVAAIDTHPDESLGFILVDGHYRQACVVAAQRKLAKGGLLVIDNSNWLPMNEWFVPNSYEHICTAPYGGYTQTSVWRKM